MRESGGPDEVSPPLALFEAGALLVRLDKETDVSVEDSATVAGRDVEVREVVGNEEGRLGPVNVEASGEEDDAGV